MKRVNNKILLAVLGGLLVIFLLNRFFRAPGLERNLPETLVQLDTSAVRVIGISNATGDSITLARENKLWYVKTASKKAETDPSAIQSVLRTISNMRPGRLVARNKEKWGDYQVGDSSIHVSVANGDELVAYFVVGKSEFNPTPTGGGSGSVTYVRLADENDVYEIQGSITSVFDKDFNDWRSKAFLRTDKENISKITFSYPADSGFVAEQRDSLWWVNGIQADAAKMNRYLNTWASKNLYSFATVGQPTGQADVRIQAEGPMGPVGSYEAWKSSDGEWLLRSSVQPDVCFLGREPTVLRDLLVSRNELAAKTQ